mmetsp:Transcript_66122/g.134571  ORF Transcript_66122/g.134571 Transcript_66122/m.134571 type:complete len:689 (-) Transcript_66122:11-2077(-)
MPGGMATRSSFPAMDGFQNPSLGRSSSMMVGPPAFQFKFEAGVPGTTPPASTGSAERPLSRERTQNTSEETPLLPTRCESQAAVAVGAPTAIAPPATVVRGRQGILGKQESPFYGVSQESVGCTMQLDECVARCRREVQAIAAECRSRCRKYCDPDFPADERSLYINGRFPAHGGALALDQLPATWRRASEGALAGVAAAAGGQPSPDPSAPFPQHGTGDPAEVLIPGSLGGVELLGALAAVRMAGKEPRELIVWREPEAGVYGVRLFKDGEWIYEILDDNLPLGAGGQPSCSIAVSQNEPQDWPALVEKAYAKVHGSYEAVAQGSEAEALEDVLGMGATSVEVVDFPIWGELWQHLQAKKRRGCLQLAVRRQERAGEALTSGLISGYGYPLTRLELVDGEMICELQNPWPRGAWAGRWGPGSPELVCRRGRREVEPTPGGCNPFWMSIQDFCKHFTEVLEARLVPSQWQSCAVTCSTERPSYPLISVASPTQAIFVLTQSDRRWSKKAEYDNALGLKVYRCRIVAPPQNAVGVKQNVSSPFKNLELLAERPMSKAHTVVLEVARLEPTCLYIAAVESEHGCTYANLRILTAMAPRFRELSAPESSYFLQAQTTAPHAIDTDSFSSQGSVENNMNGANVGAVNARSDPMKDGYDPGLQNGWNDWADDDDLIKVPKFLQACMGSCTGEC